MSNKGMSDYERQRLANIDRNNKMLASLGIPILSPPIHKTKPRTSRVEVVAAAPSRASNRLAQLAVAIGPIADVVSDLANAATVGAEHFVEVRKIRSQSACKPWPSQPFYRSRAPYQNYNRGCWRAYE